MNKRSKIFWVLLAIVGAITVVYGEGIVKIAGIFLLIIAGLVSIVMIVRIIFIRKKAKALVHCIMIVNTLQEKRNEMPLLYQGEELETKEETFDFEINVLQILVKRLIEDLKRNKGLLTPESYQDILKLEKEFNSNENEKTGRL